MKMRIWFAEFDRPQTPIVERAGTARVACGCGHEVGWPVLLDNGHLVPRAAGRGTEIPSYLLAGLAAYNKAADEHPEQDEVTFEAECPASPRWSASDADHYQADAARTAAKLDPGDPTALAVLALGLAGEAGEVCMLVRDGCAESYYKTALEKELGDVLWYVAMMARHASFSLSSIAAPIWAQSEAVLLAKRSNGRGEQDAAMDLFIAASVVADHAKKVIGHGHQPSSGLISTRLAIMVALLGSFGMPLKRIADANIEKLKARYPEGFSTERSVNRGAS